MKKLEMSMDENATCIYRYLVKCDDDIPSVIGQIIVDENLSIKPKTFGMDVLPKAYPYVLIAYGDQEHDYIDFTAVTLDDFKE